MVEFVLAFVVFLLLIAGMSVGVIFSNKPIKGTCGGMASLGIDTSWDICGGDTSKCDEEQERLESLASTMSYDATKP